MSMISLEQLIRHARSWPEEDQVELADYARVIEARRTGKYIASDEERLAIEEGLQQADKADFADASIMEQLAGRHRG